MLQTNAKYSLNIVHQVTYSNNNTNKLSLTKTKTFTDLTNKIRSCYGLYEPRCEKTGLGFPTRSDTNRSVLPQKMARGLKFRI